MDNKTLILGFNPDGTPVDHDRLFERLRLHGCMSPTAATTYRVYSVIKSLLMLDKLRGGALQRISYNHLIPMLNQHTSFKEDDDLPWQPEFDVLELAGLISISNSHVNTHKSFFDLVRYEESIGPEQFKEWFESLIVDHRLDLLQMMARRAHEQRVVHLLIQSTFARANDKH